MEDQKYAVLFVYTMNTPIKELIYLWKLNPEPLLGLDA